jgi:hypothetical protein
MVRQFPAGQPRPGCLVPVIIEFPLAMPVRNRPPSFPPGRGRASSRSSPGARDDRHRARFRPISRPVYGGQVSQMPGNPFAELEQMTGLASVKYQVRPLADGQSRAAALGRRPTNCHAPTARNLHRPPGTAKTTVARLIGAIYPRLGLPSSGQLIEVTRADLTAATSARPPRSSPRPLPRPSAGVQFIDETCALVLSDSPKDFGHEAIAILLKLMEHRGDLVVIAAGYEHEVHASRTPDPGLASASRGPCTSPATPTSSWPPSSPRGRNAGPAGRLRRGREATCRPRHNPAWEKLRQCPPRPKPAGTGHICPGPADHQVPRRFTGPPCQGSARALGRRHGQHPRPVPVTQRGARHHRWSRLFRLAGGMWHWSGGGCLQESKGKAGSNPCSKRHRSSHGHGSGTAFSDTGPPASAGSYSNFHSGTVPPAISPANVEAWLTSFRASPGLELICCARPVVGQKSPGPLS